jgi:hypothetical protein
MMIEKFSNFLTKSDNSIYRDMYDGSIEIILEDFNSKLFIN